ncbi:MAG: hypothetical protein RL021_1809, partial [Bacteroidota bacterium]
MKHYHSQTPGETSVGFSFVSTHIFTRASISLQRHLQFNIPMKDTATLFLSQLRVLLFSVSKLFLKSENTSLPRPKPHSGSGILRPVAFVLALLLVFGAGESWGQTPTNGGFELDAAVTTTPNSWTVTGTTTTTNARTGSYSLVSNSSTSNSNT